MPTQRLIVCEQTGRWAAALRLALENERLRIVETRSLAECGERLEESPEALVAVELTPANLDAVLEWLLNFERNFPDARVVVLADRGLEGYELLARELGAVHFTTSPRQLDQMIPLVRAFQPRRPGELSPTEQILADLPWDE
jgi:DNA-binding response OmpR family regulator